MNREEKLHLLQLAYRRWIVKFPGEEMGQIDCNLPLIQTNLRLGLSVLNFGRGTLNSFNFGALKVEF